MCIKVNEIFRSIQGEGKYIGYLHLFLRFSGCNIRCAYCDTDHSGYQSYSSSELIKKIGQQGDFRTLSLTGGEPLIQAEAILPMIERLDCEILLETNSTLPDNLKMVLPYVHIISADYKPFFHRFNYSLFHEFISLASEKECYIKIVFGKDSDIAQDIEKIMHDFPNIPLFIQPVSPFSADDISYGAQMIEEFAGADIRLIPQIHPVLDIR
ncbi:MAG: 7-carboxy-7-deazaguanine synthase QueE [Fibrobacterota bacterium]